MNWWGRALVGLIFVTAPYGRCDTTTIETREYSTLHLRGAQECTIETGTDRYCDISLWRSPIQDARVTGTLDCGGARSYGVEEVGTMLRAQCGRLKDDTNPVIRMSYDLVITARNNPATDLTVHAWNPGAAMGDIDVKGVVTTGTSTKPYTYHKTTTNSVKEGVLYINSSEWLQTSPSDRTITLEYPGRITMKEGEEREILRTSGPVILNVSTDLGGIVLQGEAGQYVPLNTDTVIASRVVIRAMGGPLGVSEGQVVINVSTM